MDRFTSGISAKARKMATGDDFVYYDARLLSPLSQHKNKGTVPTIINPTNTIAVFSEQRSQAIIDDPSKYYLSIVRFTCGTDTLPLFIFPVCNSLQYDVGDDNVDESAFIVTLEYSGFIASARVYWRPEDLSVGTPDVASDVNLYQTSSYFYCYTYQHLCDLINTAFNNAFTILSGETTPPTSFIPFIKYDRSKGVFDIVVDGANYCNKNYDGSDNSSQIQIYFNVYLYDLFFNVQADHIMNTYNPFQALATNKDYLLRFETTGTNVYDNSTTILYYDPYQATPKPYADTVMIMNVEWNIDSNICENMEMLFTTSQIPTGSQYVSPYIPYINQTTSSNTFQKQLTDFAVSPSVDATDSTRNVLTYVPTVYRYIDMNGTTPLTQLDIFIYWINNRGLVIPFYLSTRTVFTMKMMFVKKEVLTSLIKEKD